jgi:hypothetical protein
MLDRAAERAGVTMGLKCQDDSLPVFYKSSAAVFYSVFASAWRTGREF